MNGFTLTTPVAFLIFNRPDTTRKVFTEIAKAKPPKLLVVADGPRLGREGEVQRCEAARKIIEKVDWDCEVLKNYADMNMGCKNRVSSGLDWVFENVDEAIILEDDCVPHPTFFRFCEELLRYYRDNERVLSISGTNWLFGRQVDGNSYYFSKFNLIWGWATWRRAWKNYDVNMESFPDFKGENQIRNIFRTKGEQAHYIKHFQAVFDGKIDTWDYQWLYSTLLSGGLSIHPVINLVQNIGFGDDATHTKEIDLRRKNNIAREIPFPLKHPDFVFPDEDADEYLFENVIHPRSLLSRMENLIVQYLPEKFVTFLKKIKVFVKAT